jgi:hypothetical protein
MLATKETAVTKPHPVHTLRASLETARLKAIKTMAATEGKFSPDALQELAILQAALTAAREEIEAHDGERLGWGGEDKLC